MDPSETNEAFAERMRAQRQRFWMGSTKPPVDPPVDPRKDMASFLNYLNLPAPTPAMKTLGKGIAEEVRKIVDAAPPSATGYDLEPIDGQFGMLKVRYRFD